jgi:chlorobactene glucosyltransferase
VLRLIGLLLAIVLWTLAWNRRRDQRPAVLRPPASKPAGVSDDPLVSIILPARNEASSIEACVRSLLAQDYSRFEIIAIDDFSEDETAAILQRLSREDERLTFVQGSSPPAGSMGKANAIVQAYARARGDWILFTDADTVHQPWLLAEVMRRLRTGPVVATVWADQRHPGASVRIVNLAVLVYLSLAVDFRRLADPRSRQSLVNGQYVVIARDVYEAIGTHREVARYSSTDVSLGYLAKLGGGFH